MSERATKHLQSVISETEWQALAVYQTVSMTAATPSAAARELLTYALTKLGYIEDCNGNITKLVSQYTKPKQPKQDK